MNIMSSRKHLTGFFTKVFELNCMFQKQEVVYWEKKQELWDRFFQKYFINRVFCVLSFEDKTSTHVSGVLWHESITSNIRTIYLEGALGKREFFRQQQWHRRASLLWEILSLRLTLSLTSKYSNNLQYIKLTFSSAQKEKKASEKKREGKRERYKERRRKTEKKWER